MVCDLVSQGFDARYLGDLQIDIFFDVYERYIQILQMKIMSMPMMPMIANEDKSNKTWNEGNKTFARINLTESSGKDENKKGRMR